MKCVRLRGAWGNIFVIAHRSLVCCTGMWLRLCRCLLTVVRIIAVKQSLHYWVNQRSYTVLSVDVWSVAVSELVIEVFLMLICWACDDVCCHVTVTCTECQVYLSFILLVISSLMCLLSQKHKLTKWCSCVVSLGAGRCLCLVGDWQQDTLAGERSSWAWRKVMAA